MATTAVDELVGQHTIDTLSLLERAAHRAGECGRVRSSTRRIDHGAVPPRASWPADSRGPRASGARLKVESVAESSSVECRGSSGH